MDKVEMSGVFLPSVDSLGLARDQAFKVADSEFDADRGYVKDADRFLMHGRLWLALLTVHDEIHGETPDGCVFEDLVREAFTASEELILEKMYG